jgi:hypothetical protein
MNIVVQFTMDEEAKAIPILYRHSPGTILPNRTYVIDVSAAEALRNAGVVYREVRPQLNLPAIEDLSIGERI